jgi:hypothetical protein
MLGSSDRSMRLDPGEIRSEEILLRATATDGE